MERARTGPRYDFFISYSHRDLERVRRFDRVLRDLLRPPFRRYRFQVFRDETGLTAGQDLTERLMTKLRQSEWLLVFLTSATSGSESWVNKEIAYWCEELDRADRLIIVRGDEVVDLTWSDDLRTFRDAVGLPPALVSAVREAPFYADLAVGTPAADQDAAVRIAGTVLGRSPEEIAGEEFRLQRRRRLLFRSAVASLSVLTLASATGGLLAVRASATARSNERRAIADALASRALVEASDRPDKALALGIAARRFDARGAGDEVLTQLLQGATHGDRYLRTQAVIDAVAVNADGDRFVLGDDDGGVRLVENSPDARIPSEPGIRFEHPVVGLAFADAEHLLIGLRDHRLVEVTIKSPQELVASAELLVPNLRSWAFHEATGQVAAGGADDQFRKESLSLVQWRPGSLTTTATVTQFRSGLASVGSLAFDPHGTRLAIGHVQDVEVLDIETGRTILTSSEICNRRQIDSVGEVEAVAFTAAGDLVLGGNPFTSAALSGVMQTCRLAGSSDPGIAGLEQSVHTLTACGSGVLFGTRAGEYGLLRDPVASTRPFADVAGSVRATACNSQGQIVVAADNGFVHVRDPKAGRRVQGPTPYGGLSTITFPIFAGEAEDLKAEEVVGAGLEDRTRALRTLAGRVLSSPDLQPPRLATLLAGGSSGPSNCLTVGHPVLFFSVRDVPDQRSLGHCRGLEIRTTDKRATKIELWRGSTRLSQFGAGSRGTHSLAWSNDGRRLFVGGELEGILYEVSDPRSPRQLLRMTSDALFGAASFAAGSNLLITAVVSPPNYLIQVQATVVDGPPLDRLACLVGGGSLQDTIATQLIGKRARSRLQCATA